MNKILKVRIIHEYKSSRAEILSYSPDHYEYYLGTIDKDGGRHCYSCGGLHND